jgi:hypothetical protein
VRLVPDTNIYRLITKCYRNPTVICGYSDTIAEFGKEIYMPVVVIAELTFGFMKGAKQEDNEKNFSKLSTNCN